MKFLGNSKVFSAQNQVVSKKKKKKVFSKIETDFSIEIGNSNVFSTQNQVVSKKKKQSEIQTFEEGLFSYGGGGTIFNFSQKIGLKSTKNVRFCILHKPMGGARAPPRPPGYATGLVQQTVNCIKTINFLMGKVKKFHDFWTKVSQKIFVLKFPCVDSTN